MGNAISKAPPSSLDPILFSVSDEIIERNFKPYLELQCQGVEDRGGLALVHKARMECVSARTSIDKTRKAMGEESRKYIAAVNAEAKRLTDILAPIEEHLKSQEDLIEEEIERRKQEEADALYSVREKRLRDAGAKIVNESLIRSMDEKAFEFEVLRVADEARQEHEAAVRAFEEETKRQQERAAEVERNRLEAERLAAERAKMDRERAEHQARIDAENAKLAAARAEQEAAQRKIDAEKERLVAAERERVRQEQLEQARKGAAEKARIETEQRLAREAAAAKAKASQEEADRVRRESMRPAREKLLAFADHVEGLEIPEVRESFDLRIQAALDAAGEVIRECAEEAIQ